MKVKDAASVTSKWSQRAQAAGQAYTDGVKNPRNDWATATAGASDNWGQGVQAAVSDGRFSKGVQAAGTQAWASGAVNKGATRYGPGVAASTNKFQTGVSKFLQVLQGVTLPPRGPKGSPQNLQRTAAVATALRTAKLQG